MKKTRRLRLSKETLIRLERVGAGTDPLPTDVPTWSGCTCIPTCRAEICGGTELG